MKKIISGQKYSEERALFNEKDAFVSECAFEVGESPIKECDNVEIDQSIFRGKYPIWYSRNISLTNSVLYVGARAGIWYIDDLLIENTTIDAPKTVRRCNNVTMKDVYFPDAVETLWNCDNVRINNVNVKGDYFAYGTNNIEAEKLNLMGNYSFDGSKNVTVKNSRLVSRDAFWNTENVTVYDTFISGEYLGWNAKNLTLENCTIESLQGMCYIENLVMKNCRLINTTLAFEYSDVDVEITGNVNSILNPKSGIIKADHIDTLIIQREHIGENKTSILCENIGKRTDVIEW